MNDAPAAPRAPKTVEEQELFGKAVAYLCMFEGLPPYGGGGNPHAGDPHFMKMVRSQFPEPVLSAASAFVEKEAEHFDRACRYLVESRGIRELVWLHKGGDDA